MRYAVVISPCYFRTSLSCCSSPKLLGDSFPVKDEPAISWLLKTGLFFFSLPVCAGVLWINLWFDYPPCNLHQNCNSSLQPSEITNCQHVLLRDRAFPLLTWAIGSVILGCGIKIIAAIQIYQCHPSSHCNSILLLIQLISAHDKWNVKKSTIGQR